MAIGYSAASSLVDSGDCVVIGYEAGVDMDSSGSTPQKCTYIGNYAGKALDDGSLNTAVGYNAMKGGTGGNSCTNNVAVGYRAMTAIITGDSNTALGSDSAYSIDSGGQNVCIGANAGAAITSGGANTCVGNDTDADGDQGNQIAIGNSAITAGANRGRWGNSSVTTNNIQTDWTVDSDRRIKDDIKDSSLGLSFINSLKPRTFIKIHPADYPEPLLEKRYKSGGYNYDDDKNEIIRDEFEEKVWNGLIAQEVKESMDSLGVDFSGWGEENNGKQGVTYSTLVMPLIKAVQELSAKVKALENA
jgi:hypothetical protein